MASLSSSVICWFLLLLAWRTDGQNCPQANSIFPPSGTIGVVFTINGSGLQGVNEVMVGTSSSGVQQRISEDAFVSRNDTHLQFTLNQPELQTGLVPVELVATNNPPCSNAQIMVDLRRRKLCVHRPHL